MANFSNSTRQSTEGKKNRHIAILKTKGYVHTHTREGNEKQNKNPKEHLLPNDDVAENMKGQEVFSVLEFSLAPQIGE